MGDFRVFRSKEATCCTDCGEIWRGGVGQRFFTPNLTESMRGRGVGPENWKIDKRPTGAYPLGDFYQIFTPYVGRTYHDQPRIKIWSDLLKGFRNYQV